MSFRPQNQDGFEFACSSVPFRSSFHSRNSSTSSRFLSWIPFPLRTPNLPSTKLSKTEQCLSSSWLLLIEVRFSRSTISLRSLSAPRSFCSVSASFAVLARKQHAVLSVATEGFVESRNPLDPIELRRPQEYITIAKAVGLSADKANEAVHRNPLKALEHGSF